MVASARKEGVDCCSSGRVYLGWFMSSPVSDDFFIVCIFFVINYDGLYHTEFRFFSLIGLINTYDKYTFACIPIQNAFQVEATLN
jgi:hypothetical protein